MKKFTYIFAALLVVLAVSSCVKEVGTQPGNDSTPSVIVYTYKPGAEYNADNDVALRFASNSKVAKAYYLVELKETKDAYIKKSGEDAYAKYVVEKGTALKLNGAAAEDMILTGVAGTNSITAVGVDANGNLGKAFSVEFTGLSWTTLCTGTIVPEYTLIGKAFPATLQKCDQIATRYRLDKFYESTVPFVFDLEGDAQTDKSGDKFYNFGCSSFVPTGWFHKTYGEVSVGTYALAAGSVTYNTYNYFYPEDNYFYFYAVWRVSAGYLNTGSYVDFYPDGK